MNTKICSKCNKNLPYEHFWKCKKNKDGYYYVCKTCKKNNASEEQKEKARKRAKEYYKNNREKVLKYQKEYSNKNKEDISFKASVRYYKKYIDITKKRNKEYRDDIRNNIFARLVSRMHPYGYNVNDLVFDRDEYIDNVISKLKKEQLYDRFIGSDIEIDHITPISRFENKMDAFHWDNIQFLTKDEHIMKTRRERNGLKRDAI